MPSHRKAITAVELAKVLGVDPPEVEPGPNELAVTKVIEETENPNEGLAALGLSLAKLMDSQPSAATARQLRETIIAIGAPVEDPKEKKGSLADLMNTLQAN